MKQRPNDKALIGAAIAAIILGLAYYWMSGERGGAGVLPDVSSRMVDYFIQEMDTRGVARLGGRPIEGFEAELFLEAFPGLHKEDFDGVLTLEGEYVMQNGMLVYRRIKSQPITSAEKTIGKEGMTRLLQRLASRLGIVPRDEFRIDAIVAAVANGQEEFERAVETAILDFIERTGFPVEEVLVRSSRAAEWPDSCLGYAGEGEACLQVITPGYDIVFSAFGKEYRYHTNRDGSRLKFVPTQE